VTALDEVAWLLNIRGRDTPYTPVLRAYLVITEAQISLYVPADKLNDEVKKQLRTDNCYSPHCARSDARPNIYIQGVYKLLYQAVLNMFLWS
jgi:Xaa-Pro aminopeptidase